jgi:hypothetical protein
MDQTESSISNKKENPFSVASRMGFQIENKN